MLPGVLGPAKGASAKVTIKPQKPVSLPATMTL